MKRFLSLVLIFIFLQPTSVYAGFSDSSNETYGFASGSYSNTQWDSGNTWFELDATGLTNGSGTYTSRVIDALASTSWSSLSWTPSRPYLKELPDSAASESAYSAGNVTMSSNVLLMHMNESSGSLSDTSGSSITGTVSGNPTYSSSGLFNSSLLFDGTGDYAALTNSSNLQSLSAPTISAWVKRTGGNSQSRGIYSKMTLSGGNYKGYSLILGTDNKFAVWAGNNSTIYTVSKSDSAYTDSNWHHVAAVKTGGKFLLYVDGVLQTEQATSPVTDTGAAAVIGRKFSNLNQDYFVGNIDEVAVFNTAFDATAILNLYRRGAQRLRFQVRSCDDALCSGENFVGPGGSTSTYFEEQDANSASLVSASLSGVVSSNRYFQYQTTLETSSSSYSPDVKSVTVGSPSVGVLYDNFSTSYGTTDLSATSNLSSVSGFKLANANGSVQWVDAQDVRQQDFNSSISLGSDFVSIDSASLPSSFDAGATVAFENVDCNAYVIYYKSSVSSSADDIINTGQQCNETSTPACSSISCTGGTLSFTVPHFDSYAVNTGGAGVPEFPSLPALFVLVAGAFWYLSKTTVPQNPGKFA